jgi:hypothetical protein
MAAHNVFDLHAALQKSEQKAKAKAKAKAKRGKNVAKKDVVVARACRSSQSVYDFGDLVWMLDPQMCDGADPLPRLPPGVIDMILIIARYERAFHHVGGVRVWVYLRPLDEAAIAAATAAQRIRTAETAKTLQTLQRIRGTPHDWDWDCGCPQCEDAAYDIDSDSDSDVPFDARDRYDERWGVHADDCFCKQCVELAKETVVYDRTYDEEEEDMTEEYWRYMAEAPERKSIATDPDVERESTQTHSRDCGCSDCMSSMMARESDVRDGYDGYDGGDDGRYPDHWTS